MKKILFAFAMLAMVAGFTSCGDDNNGNNKGKDMTTTQFLAMSAKTRINSVLIYDCDFTAKFTAKYADKTATLVLNNVKFAEKMPAVDFVIDGIKFTQEGSVFTFEASSVKATGGYTVAGLKGKIDTENNVYNITFYVDATYEVLLTSPYNCSDNLPSGTDTQKSYTFKQSTEGAQKKLRFSIMNVKFSDKMPFPLKEMAVYFNDGDGWTITNTATGYTFESASITPYYKAGTTEIPMDSRQMTNVKGTVDLVNRKFTIDFDCFGEQYSDKGSLYL